MKNVLIFHGTSCNPNSFWYPYVKNDLEKDNYKVLIPSLPNPDTPTLSEQLPFCLENFDYNKETILIGHSAGCPLILSVLENIKTKIKLVVLVSGFIDQLGEEKDLILQETYNWPKIKDNCKNFVFINSDNDPWGCDDKQGKRCSKSSEAHK